MGGQGSGNHWRYDTKAKMGEYRSLDIRHCARRGMLAPGQWNTWQWSRGGRPVGSIQMRAEQDRVILNYRHQHGGDEWKAEEYPVSIVRTPCNLGGTRPWFICPALGCGGRVAILYGGAIFACRHCHRLAYESASETAGDRAARKADRLRNRLQWEPGILNGRGWKPKWMRWPTFSRLALEHDRLVNQSLLAIGLKLGILDRHSSR